MQPITNTRTLTETCERLARHPFVTVDTEFLRESTYYPKLCVLQMASVDESVVVDALAPDISLTPLFALLADPRVVKVFHAARQDVEICWHEAQMIPAPLFDTQVAAMVLGYGDSISYDQLVHRITGDTLDKSSRFTDWTRRPLSEAQLTYAVSDVTHLRDVYLKLSADLERQGRAEWMRDEMRILTSPDTYRMEPEHAWERLKTRVRKPKDLAVLIEVAAWREREAQTRDVPREPRAQGRRHRRRRHPGADHRGAARAACARCRKGSSARNGARRSSTRSSAGWPAIPRRCRRLDRAKPAVNGQATVELLKVLLRMTSEKHGVAAKVIATVDDLDRIAADDHADVPALRGWRRDLFGEKALALKHGKLALSVENGGASWRWTSRPSEAILPLLGA